VNGRAAGAGRTFLTDRAGALVRIARDRGARARDIAEPAVPLR
jgi:hypothetical protein